MLFGNDNIDQENHSAKNTDDVGGQFDAGTTDMPSFEIESQEISLSSGLDEDGVEEPDFADNPKGFREPESIRRNLRAEGIDPMDVNDENSYEFAEAALRETRSEQADTDREFALAEAEHDLVVFEGDRKFGDAFSYEPFPERD